MCLTSLSVTRIVPGPMSEDAPPATTSARPAAATTNAIRLLTAPPVLLFILPSRSRCDRDRLEAPDHEGRHPQRLFGQLEARRALDQRPQRRLELDSCERRPDADVDAAAEA